MKINLIELFEQTANSYPQKIAVIDKDREITFSVLRRMAMQLAMKIGDLAVVRIAFARSRNDDILYVFVRIDDVSEFSYLYRVGD